MARSQKHDVRFEMIRNNESGRHLEIIWSILWKGFDDNLIPWLHAWEDSMMRVIIQPPPLYLFWFCSVTR